MIYLDNAATTYPKPESVYQAMDKANRELAVNAGRGSYKLAQKATALIDETKEKLRKIVNVQNEISVVFSPSVTIAMNQIINGIEWREGSTIYVSPYEHNAVARPLHYISKKKQIVIKEIPIDKSTLCIDLEKMKYEFSKDRPSGIFCTHISNVTGYILPIEEIFKEGKRYGSTNILDTAQSLGLLEIDSTRVDVDLIAFAGHKSLYGPFGIGGFVNVTNVPLQEYIVGGTGSDSLNLNMPQSGSGKFEAASCNIPAIAGLHAALDLIDISRIQGKERTLTEILVKALREIPEVVLYVPENWDSHIGIVSFTIDGMLADDVGLILDEDYDIAVRTGYHCAPYIHKYLKDGESLGTVRASIGKFTTTKEIDALIEAVQKIVK